MTAWLDNSLLRGGLKAFAVSVLLTPVLRDVFRAYNVVDRPGHRRLHAYPVPRIGGIPIAAAYAFGLYSLSNSGIDLGFPLWKLLPGAGVVFLTGLLDDFFTLRPAVKLTGQILAALLIFWNGLHLGTLGAGSVLPVWLDLPLTVFWLLLTTNALNLIDGLDGLCAGVGLVATLTLFGAAILYGNQPLMYATLPLACALVGFLFYNVNPATVFLGDSGALLVGFLLGCYGMIWTQKTSTLLSLLVPLMALSVPLLDVMLSVLRRLIRRQPIFTADRAHIHHRLLDRGLTPKSAVLVLYLFAAGGAAVALMLSAPQAARFHNLLVALLVAAILLGLRELQYREFNLFGKLLFGGEFQQSLQAKLRLDRLSISLAGAQTPEAWWRVLEETARDCGWARLRWIGSGGVREAGSPPATPAWTFQAPMGDWGSIEIDGASGSQSVDLADFAATLRRSVENRAPAGMPVEVH